MLQTLNFFDSRNRMQKLNSHGAIGRPPVEEEEIATGPRMLYGIFNKIHYSVTFEASKTTKAKVAWKEKKSWNIRICQLFEIICVYAERFSGMIPITFLTGFYVSQVVNRWWDQFMSLPWPDRLALKLVCYCPGTDDFNKNLRRTVMRYVNLSTILVYRLVSEKVWRIF